MNHMDHLQYDLNSVPFWRSETPNQQLKKQQDVWCETASDIQKNPEANCIKSD